jgi:hypothetical protein
MAITAPKQAAEAATSTNMIADVEMPKRLFIAHPSSAAIYAGAVAGASK